MFKKWQKYLLENYPHIWNMRLPGVLAVITGLHLFHFFVGYIHFNSEDNSTSYWDHPASVFFSSSFALFSIIGSVLVFIVWLSRVFRNNPFKSFYPYSNNQLFGQFLVLLLVSFLNVSYFFSYTKGFISAGSRGISLEDAKQGAAAYNRLFGLLQDRKEAYTIESRCGNYPFPLRKMVDPDKAGLSADMLHPGDYFYEANDGRRFTAAQVDSLSGGIEYSYLNFCNSYPVLPLDVNDQRLATGMSIQEEVLNDPKQLRADMETLVSLMKDQDIAHNINAEQWFNLVYHPPYFPLKQTIIAGKAGSGFYIDHYELQKKLRATFLVRQFSFEPAVLLSFLYLALGITLFVFTFRATQKRAWMITIIGGGVISLVIGLFSALIAIAGAPEALVGFYLLIIAGFFGMHLLSTGRSWSGAALNWFTLSLPYVSVILLGWSETWRTTANGGSQSFSEWVRNNAPSYFFTFFLLYVIVVRLVLVPAYRRWQAMPE
jgi:hypothetical protein